MRVQSPHTLTIYPVLNAGSVALVDHMGSDLSVVRAARASYDAACRAGEDEGSDTRLIRYLWRNQHTTPFEAVTFTFQVRAPIFVFRQWHRHRTWAYNELSARYRELPTEFYVPDLAQITQQATDNKQGRDDVQNENAAWIRETMITSMRASFRTYHDLLRQGCPRELARIVLPLATYSHMFATVNLLNLLKFLSLRAHSHAQWEARQYALGMIELIKPIVPVCLDTWANTPPRLDPK
jgi:thymidylate synthase (FAD)